MIRMSPEAAALDALLFQIRRTFRDLAALGDLLHADHGISAARRAVLEYLAENGPATVPGIARARRVSRQHIQQLADQLAGAGLLRGTPNPAHRRSPLLELTPAGRAGFCALRAREAEWLGRMAAELSRNDVASATATLEALRQQVAGAMAQIQTATTAGKAEESREL